MFVMCKSNAPFVVAVGFVAFMVVVYFPFTIKLN